MSHMDDVRARQNDPMLFIDAEARSRALTARIKAADLNQMAVQLQAAPSIKGKMIWLRKLTDALGQAAEGIVPCKAGCSHCCHMALMVTPEEAEAMAKASGRPIKMPSKRAFRTPEAENVERFDGVPCPMLKENQCSVYNDRPHPCRVHYSMDRDSLLCKIVPGEKIRAPTVNVDKFNMLFFVAHGDPRRVRHADIREYFK